MEVKESLQKLASAMLEAQLPLARQTLIEYVSGKESSETSELRLDEMESFGIGEAHDEDYWGTVIDAAYEKGYLKEKSTRNDALVLTADGKKFLKKPVSFVIADEDEDNPIPGQDDGVDDLIDTDEAGHDQPKAAQASGHAQQFIKLIRAIDRKIDLDEYAETENIPFDEVLDSLDEMVKQRRKVDITYFTNEVIGEEGIEELSECFDTYGTKDLSKVEDEYGDVYREEEIRLARVVYMVRHMK